MSASIPELDADFGDAVRVCVCADRAALRRSLIRALEADDDIVVVGEESDSRRIGFMARELAPDCVVLDMAAEPLTGAAGVVHVRGHAPTTRIALLGSHADEDAALAAVEAGAVGFVNRDRLAQAPAVVRAVTAGVVALPPLVAGLLKADLERLAASSATRLLDERAAAVLGHLAAGHSYAGAAGALGIPPATARNLVANAVERLARRAS